MTKSEAAQLVPGDKVRLIEFTEATLPKDGIWFPDEYSGKSLVVHSGPDELECPTIEAIYDGPYCRWMHLDIRLISHKVA